MNETHPTPYIFVYGTLRRMDSTGKNTLIGLARYLGLGRVRGSLFHLSEYPGAVGSESGWIVGEVYELENFGKQIVVLDRYEGCAADSAPPHEYRRETTVVTLNDGQKVTAWIYWFLKDISELSPIVSGDWLSVK